MAKCHLVLLSLDVSGVRGDLASLDALLRLCLAAKREGCRLAVRGAPAELLELATFVGVEEVLLDGTSRAGAAGRTAGRAYWSPGRT